ncbi:MAG: hypothetical protein IBJ11_03315 [Phycisphaerales bacterium]|nr:hypothetical protein [Phycisphaerales bacterium]
MTPADDGLYVNYLPVPAGVRRFLRRATPSMLGVMLLFGAAWAFSQRSPGEAVWDDGKPRTISGVLLTRPYPVLLTDDGVSVLLVEVGKHGPRDLAHAEGRRCEIVGWPLEREGRTMIELEPGADAVRPGSAHGPVPAARSLGRVALRGEIVDSKCYLGAMKPGEGKTHKACATLCVRGGIPPMLAVDTPGGPRFVLVADADGGPMPAECTAFIAEPVEVRGELFERGGLYTIRTRAADMSPAW